MGFKGKFSVSRYTGGVRGEGITISVTDDASGITFLEIDCDPASFGRAVTGLGFQPCEITEFRPDNVGKTLEVKTVSVMVPKGRESDRVELAAAAVAEREGDGWRGRVADALNHHNRIHGKGTETHECYKVAFRRYVETPA
jgi:hypothetical protein